MVTANSQADGAVTTLIDELLSEQRTLTAVDRFSRHHDQNGHSQGSLYQALLPAAAPGPGEQYAFQVDLDACSGCKACVAGCHSLNGLDDNETWREVGLLVGGPASARREPGDRLKTELHHVTSACHHCVDPGCLNGCPVKAYDKDPATGIVRHLDDQCIGCQYCVMKCPYEVPKYSSTLGIVRKCDMCVNRLSAGEAPACVQSCPNGAIAITVVKQKDVRAQFRRNDECLNHNDEGNPTDTKPNGSSGLRDYLGIRASSLVIPKFLADAPDPAITLPTTRYLSKQSPSGLVAGDHHTPRLDHPHWPLIVMLLSTQAAAGLFLAATVVPSPMLALAGFGLLNLGLLAAPLHLGRPLKAWRAFLGWRTSWLSREIIAFNILAGAAAFAVTAAWLPLLAQKFAVLATVLRSYPSWLPSLENLQGPAMGIAAVIGLGSVFVSAMVYIDTKRSFWSPRHAFGAFFGTMLLLGSTFAAVVFAWQGRPDLARWFAVAAVLVRTVLFSWRRWEIGRAFNDPASPVHLNARAIRELLPWTPPVRLSLFIASTVFGSLAIADLAHTAMIWASAAAVTTLASEIVVRYVFFRAGAGKKMPGGIA